MEAGQHLSRSGITTPGPVRALRVKNNDRIGICSCGAMVERYPNYW